MTDKLKGLLAKLEQQGSSEAWAVAMCLRDIAENEDSNEDEFLLDCAKEIRGWADYLVKAMEGNI